MPRGDNLTRALRVAGGRIGAARSAETRRRRAIARRVDLFVTWVDGNPRLFLRRDERREVLQLLARAYLLGARSTRRGNRDGRGPLVETAA